MVATRLPEKAEQNTSLAASGFVTYSTVGGSPNVYVPERQPVLSIKCYGFPPISASRKPQIAVANQLAENIAAACQLPSSFNAVLTLPSGYPQARVHQANLMGEPRPAYGDQSHWAVYQFDLQLFWIELPS